MISSRFSGSPSGTGYPPICSAPPPAPGTGIPCPYLQNAPKRWTFHPNAIVDAACSQCAKMNTAFPLDWKASCQWIHDIPAFLSPNGDFGWRWILDLSDNGTRLTIANPFGPVAHWRTPALPPPGGASITVTLEGHDDACCTNWSPTITLTPVPVP